MIAEILRCWLLRANSGQLILVESLVDFDVRIDTSVNVDRELR